MKHQVSTARQPWLRTAIYSFMTLTVAVIVALLMLIVLGFSFNQKDGKIEQGGLLQFDSIPSGATVTLDQIKLGSLTTTKSTVDKGNHFVTYDLANYRTWQKSINIVPGQIGWLSYARLIPKTITPKTVHTYPALAGALAAPDRNYMLLHEAADQPVFTLADIRGETLKYTTISLPATSYTAPTVGKTQSFTIDSWSSDDQGVLIRHTYDDNKMEWLLLDHNTPDNSININTAYAITPSKVEFAGGGSKLLFVQTDDTVRRINLDEQTLSRPLVSNVDNYSAFDDKTITYSTKPDDKLQRTVGYAAIDIPLPQTEMIYPADGKPLFADMSNYFNQHYVVITHGQDMTILTGTLPTPNNKGTLKTFATHTLPDNPSRLVTSNNGRFVFATFPDGYGTFDLELTKFDKTTWAYPSAVKHTTPLALNGLDDYITWSDYGGQLRLYEFDGANQQNIMPVTEGFTVSLSTNDKYIYGIDKTDKGFELRRAQLVL